MELTLESAFSTGGLVGHTSYLLLVISMLMRRITLLRIFVLASSFVAIAYDIFWLKDPIGVFWETLLVAVNIFQLCITWYENRTASFTPPEAALHQQLFSAMDKGDFRRLLAKGNWVTGKPGTELTREGEPVPHLIYIASGAAVVRSGGRVVATCGPGTLIGEMTVLDNGNASGTVRLNAPSLCWMIDADLLRKLVYRKPDLGQAMHSAFSINMKQKLISGNSQRLATRA